MGPKLNLNCCSTNNWTFWKWFQSQLRDSHLEKRRDYHYTSLLLVPSQIGIFCCNVFCHFFRSLFETLEPSKWTYEDPCLWFLVSLDTVKYFAQLFFTAGRLLGVRNFIASGSREKGVLLQLHISRRGAGERYFSITILSWIVVCSLCALWRQIAVVPLRVCWKFSSTNRCYVLKTHFRGCKQPTWNISRPKKSEGTRLIKVFATFCS